VTLYCGDVYRTVRGCANLYLASYTGIGQNTGPFHQKRIHSNESRAEWYFGILVCGVQSTLNVLGDLPKTWFRATSDLLISMSYNDIPLEVCSEGTRLSSVFRSLVLFRTQTCNSQSMRPPHHINEDDVDRAVVDSTFQMITKECKEHNNSTVSKVPVPLCRGSSNNMAASHSGWTVIRRNEVSSTYTLAQRHIAISTTAVPATMEC
jgi:hypothetical protein